MDADDLMTASNNGTAHGNGVQEIFSSCEEENHESSKIEVLNGNSGGSSEPINNGTNNSLAQVITEKPTVPLESNGSKELRVRGVSELKHSKELKGIDKVKNEKTMSPRVAAGVKKGKNVQTNSFVATSLSTSSSRPKPLSTKGTSNDKQIVNKNSKPAPALNKAHQSGQSGDSEDPSSTIDEALCEDLEYVVELMTDSDCSLFRSSLSLYNFLFVSIFVKSGHMIFWHKP